MEEFPSRNLEQLALTFRYDIDDGANWKIALDAQNEIYHLPVLGPVHGAFTDVLETNEEGCTRFNEFKRLGRHTVYSSAVNPEWAPVGLEKLILDVPTSPAPIPQNGFFDFYVVFPNFVMGFLPGQMFTYNFWPLAVDRTRWEIRVHFPKARNAAELVVQHYRKTLLRDAQAEDIESHENVHDGLVSRAKREMWLQDEEVQIRSFHHVWRQYFEAARPAGVA